MVVFPVYPGEKHIRVKVILLPLDRKGCQVVECSEETHDVKDHEARYRKIAELAVLAEVVLALLGNVFDEQGVRDHHQAEPHKLVN
jgi:hypothetical protein